MDLAAWLEQQGLAQLEPKLREAGIDLDVLGDLENGDLAEIGLNLGDRKRLLKAIAALGQDPSSIPVAAAPSGEPQSLQLDLPPTSRPQVAPMPETSGNRERRQLTVMFCDLVGSTALSSSLDPEDLQEVLGAYHRTVTAAVRPYDGHIAQLLGDGVLVYFGFPKAHEDDADRAVRAALAVIDAVREARPKGEVQLQTRIGIATGPVVVGQIGSGTPAEELSATGETPNLAARLQAMARPGEIVIAPETRRLIGASFELTSVGAQVLKGIEQPVEPWRVAGERAVSSRFEAGHARELTPLVGREGELSTLLERWSMAREGEGQVVLLSGEAGIGKSRISHALCERLSTEPSTTLLWQCSPYFVSSALYPVVQHLERAAGFVSTDAPGARVAKLEQALASTELDGESLGYLLKLLGLPEQGRVSAGSTPQQEKAAILRALLDAVLGIARQEPVLLLLEDAHWIDPTTEELLGQAIERFRDVRVLILVTSRPEYIANWGNPTNLTRLPLSRLGQRQSAELIGSMVMGKALPESVVTEIVRKTDGIPLFAEELTKTVIESGLLTQTDSGYELKGSLSALAIPSTLQDSLMARLDQLGPAKEVAQAGATIGREFSHRLLASVVQMTPKRLAEALERLVKSELVFRRGTPPVATYQFKHALIRDTAYGSIVKTQLAVNHRRIAEAIEEHEPETVAAQPELLAFHFEAGGEIAKAISLGTSAGKRAIQQSAHDEARRHLTHALELLRNKDGSTCKVDAELAILLPLGIALRGTAGMGAAETKAVFVRAKDLLEQRGSTGDEQWSTLVYGIWGIHMARSEHEAALSYAQSALQIAKKAPSRTSEAMCMRMAGNSCLLLGRLVESEKYLRSAIAAAGSVSDQGSARLSMEDGVLAQTFLGSTLAFLGRLRESQAVSELALERAESLNHGTTLGVALLGRSSCAIWAGDVRAAGVFAGRAEEVLAKHGSTNHLDWARFNAHWSRFHSGNQQAGLDGMSRAAESARSTSATTFLPTQLALIGEALTAVGDFDAAAAAIDEGLQLAQSTGERGYEAELLRLRGRLRDLGGRASLAQADYLESLGIARTQGSKLFALRSATDLAIFLRNRGDADEGNEILQLIYSEFADEFQFPDVVRARAALV